MNAVIAINIWHIDSHVRAVCNLFNLQYEQWSPCSWTSSAVAHTHAGEMVCCTGTNGVYLAPRPLNLYTLDLPSCLDPLSLLISAKILILMSIVRWSHCGEV
jgi:hypothetical protein